MKTRSFIVLGLALILLLIVVLRRNNTSNGGGVERIETYVQTNSAQSSYVNSSLLLNTGVPTQNVVDVPAPPDGDAAYARHRYEQQTIDPLFDWKRPISFYGTVLDEVGQPIEGATVRFVWSDISDNGTSEATMTSDSDGLFNLTDRKGKGVSVSVSKAGYYTPSKERISSFEYANPYEPRFHRPNPSRPVVFHLRKKGRAEPLSIMDKSFRIPLDGTAVDVDLLTGKAVPEGQGNVRIQCWTSDRDPGSKRYDWRCQVQIPNGGLLESNNEFDFEAPPIGYRPMDEIKMPKSHEEQWRSEAIRKYFVKLGNGLYGRVSFLMIAGGDHFCRIESYVNPSGSRNLEFDPDVQPKPKNFE